MADISKYTESKTVAQIYEYYKRNFSEYRRQHLGASMIGKACERTIWYSWRWCTDPNHVGQRLKLFQRGHKEEEIIIADLRNIGIEVHNTDEHDNQFSFSEYGHFAGSIDGVGRNFKESKEWHLLEFKTSSTKYFNDLKKNGVEKSKPEHFAQMQIYMKWADLKRAFYLVVCKETDELYSERVKYDKKVALALLDKAKKIIDAERPLAKMTEDASFYLCKFCDHADICHGGKLPEINCRTCCHATPEIIGNCRWTCAFKKKEINFEEQKKACENHLFIPAFIGEVIDANPKENWIQYKDFKNGSGGYDSKELQTMINNKVKDFSQVNEIKEAFAGSKVEKVEKIKKAWEK